MDDTTLPDAAEAECGFAPLADWLIGPMRMALLRAAIDFGIPDLLTEPRSAAEVAQRLRAHPGNTRLLLDAFTAMGLAEKRGEVYRNSPLAERHLVTGGPTCLAGMARNMAAMQQRSLGRLRELVLQGPPPLRRKERLEDEDHWREAARGLAAYQRSGLADLADRLVEDLPEAPLLKHMLDLGGGPGIVGQTIVARRPGMTGVICDLPSVAQAAREEIAAHHLEGRMNVLSGDYNTMDLGGGYDLVWASQTLYYAKDLTAFLKKILAGLNPGGVFLSLHEGLERGRTGPEFWVLSRLCLAMEGQDVSFDSGRIADAMIAAGFRSVQSRPEPLPLGAARLDVGRKAGRLAGATAAASQGE